MDRVMQKLKESVVITQVAAGKEFKVIILVINIFSLYHDSQEM